MSEQPSKLEAVRRARQDLGEADSEAMARYIEARFGMMMKPAIVAVLLGSLRERETLEQVRRKAQAEMERLRAKQAEEDRPGKKKAGKAVKSPLSPG